MLLFICLKIISTINYDFLLRFRIIISKNPALQDKISLDDKFWSRTVLDFPDENNNLYFYLSRLFLGDIFSTVILIRGYIYVVYLILFQAILMPEPVDVTCSHAFVKIDIKML